MLMFGSVCFVNCVLAAGTIVIQTPSCAPKARRQAHSWTPFDPENPSTDQSPCISHMLTHRRLSSCKPLLVRLQLFGRLSPQSNDEDDKSAKKRFLTYSLSIACTPQKHWSSLEPLIATT